MIFGKGVHMFKGVGVCFADFISFFINILRPNSFIFMGYLKTGGRKGGSPEPPLDPPLQIICILNVSEKLPVNHIHLT